MKKNTKSIPYVGSKQAIALELIDEMLKYKRAYNVDFDFDKFYTWLKHNPYTVFISEYNMPQDFMCVYKIKKMMTLSKAKDDEGNLSICKSNIEKLYCNKNVLNTMNEIYLFNPFDYMEN